jgi:hypothetical protein
MAAVKLPSIEGTIRRRLLLNYRVDPEVISRILPAPFEPKLHRGHAIAGICLIRLEGIRPTGAPRAFGFSSENAAHRIAVTWKSADGPREGVYIPRRDTSSLINQAAGGRVFPGEHHAAEFDVSEDGNNVSLAMSSTDGAVSVRVSASVADALPSTSCFASVREASSFFEPGALGYSATRSGDKLQGVVLKTKTWHIEALNVSSVHSSYFADLARFPEGSAVFDHGLVMRDIAHEWHGAEDLYLDHGASSPA